MTEREEPDDRPQPIHTYTDEQGRTIRVFPARFAEGGGVQPYTAKPRGR